LQTVIFENKLNLGWDFPKRFKPKMGQNSIDLRDKTREDEEIIQIFECELKGNHKSTPCPITADRHLAVQWTSKMRMPDNRVEELLIFQGQI